MGEYVVGIGEALWDVLPEGKKLGGAPANFAYHARQFGLEGIAVSAIGPDALGGEIVGAFEEHRLPYHLARVEYPTGTVQVTLDAQGVPQYEIKTDVAWDHIPYDEELAALAADCKAVCFGSLAQRCEVSRNTIGAFLDAVPADCLKVFDINLRQHFYTKDVLEASFRRCDILKINDEELAALAADCQAVCFGSLAQRSEVSRNTIGAFLDAVPADCLKVFDINLRQHFYTKDVLETSFRRCDILKINDEELETVSRLFNIPGRSVEEKCRCIFDRYGLQMLILTCGTNGSYVFHAGGLSYQDTPKVEVADTVGAGDSFTGAFIGTILQGKSVAVAHKTAVRVSAYVCTQKGAMPVVPDELKD